MSITHSFSCVIEKRFCYLKLPWYLLHDTKTYLWITYPLDMKQGSKRRSHLLHRKSKQDRSLVPRDTPEWTPTLLAPVCLFFLQRSAASLKRASISVRSIISQVFLKKEVPSLRLRLPVLPIPLSLVLWSEPWYHFLHFLLSSSCWLHSAPQPQRKST